MLTPVPTHPTTHGNRARVVAMVEFLEALGFEVHVAVLLREDWDQSAMLEAYGARLHLIPYGRPLRRESTFQAWVRRGRQLFDPSSRHAYGGDDWYDDATDGVIERLDREIGFDLAVVEYGFMSRALQRLASPKLKVIDTHDIFANRHLMFLQSGMTPSFYSTTPDEEKLCLSRADLVLGIQAQETKRLRAYGLNAITFGHTAKIDSVFESTGSEFDLLMVGSANAMNVQGLLWFGQEVMPHLALAAPQLRIAIAGGLCSATPDFHDLKKLGVVPDLKDVYARTRVAINPVRNGTGLNIKSIEAMGFGIPLLSTKSGARGLEEAWGAGIEIADTAEAFARAALSLLDDEEGLRNRSRGALAFAKRWNKGHAEAFTSRLIAAFPSVQSSVMPNEPDHLAVTGNGRGPEFGVALK